MRAGEFRIRRAGTRFRRAHAPARAFSGARAGKFNIKAEGQFIFMCSARAPNTAREGACAPRNPRVRLAVWISAGFFFACAHIDAHPVAQGSMSIEVLSDKIVVQVRASMEEVFVQNALSTDTKETNLTPDELCRRHGDYLLLHLHVFADDKLLSGRVANVTAPQGSGVQRAVYDFHYNLQTKPGRVRIEENVLNEFDFAPGNRWEATYITSVIQENRPPIEALLLTSGEPLVIHCNSSFEETSGS